MKVGGATEEAAGAVSEGREEERRGEMDGLGV